MLRKRPDQVFRCVAFNSRGRVKGAAASLTCTISIDGGPRVSLTNNTAVEVAGEGIYEFPLTTEETDGYELAFVPRSSILGVEVLGDPSNTQRTDYDPGNTGRNSPDAVPVDHNYTAADRYSYTDKNNRGIDNATVIAYLKTDYQAGRRGIQYHQAVTQTDVNGRWVRPILLDPGEYVLYYYKQGEFGPDTASLTVVPG